jgi:hypothetical protein
MRVLVIAVNWQISVAVRRTSPSAISLNRRSSRPPRWAGRRTARAAVDQPLAVRGVQRPRGLPEQEHGGPSSATPFHHGAAAAPC